jgi:acyl-CoA dehydrogenase
MNFTLEDEELELRSEIRTLLDTALREDLRKAQRNLVLSTHEIAVTRDWLRILWNHGKGWGTPLWPKEFGGPGFSPTERFILESEFAQADAPVTPPQGVRYVGPLLIRFGSKWQQDYFLPRIQSGDHCWAQGYSEPGAGSDLASLQTTATRDGSDYVVNGSKIWTTDAHVADWIFVLVRTSSQARRQEGISVLLIDMRTPGITVRPIITLGGQHETNQVFFDDVRVPVENLVGEENKGWSYGKFVLEFERGGTFAAPRIRRLLELTEKSVPLSDASIVRRIAALYFEIEALQTMELMAAFANSGRGSPGYGTASILKLTGSRLRQAVTRLGVDALGVRAFRLDPADATGQRALATLCADERSILPRHLSFRAWTIFAGTSEVQRDIIAKEVFAS